MEQPLRWWGVAGDGAVVEVVFVPALAAEVARRWPPIGLERHEEPVGPVECRFGVGHDNVVHPDEEPLSGAPSTIGWDRLEQELTLFAAQRHQGAVPVHAAVWEHRGVAVVVPGASGAGKSRLCVAAHRAGARVLSDEYALVAPDTGLVTGWPRGVRLVDEHGAVERLDLAVVSGPVPVGLVAFVAYAPDAPAAWAPIGEADAVFGLLEHTLTARARPHEALDAALVLARAAPAVRGVRGEAAEAVARLHAELDAARAPG